MDVKLARRQPLARNEPRCPRNLRNLCNLCNLWMSSPDSGLVLVRERLVPRLSLNLYLNLFLSLSLSLSLDLAPQSGVAGSPLLGQHRVVAQIPVRAFSEPDLSQSSFVLHAGLLHHPL